MFPEFADASAQQKTYCLGINARDRTNELIVYACDKGDCAAGYARDDIGRSHTRALDAYCQIVLEVSHFEILPISSMMPENTWRAPERNPSLLPESTRS